MKKYILNGIEFVHVQFLDGSDYYANGTLKTSLTEYDLIKLGATEVKEDDWVDMDEFGSVDDWENHHVEIINQLIKNQQYLKRRLDERL